MNFIFIGLVFTLSGCSGLVLSNADRANHKVFEISEDWVKEAPENFPLGIRKINRMTPVLFHDKDQDLVIEGNSHDGIAAYSRRTGIVEWRLPVLNGVEGSAALSGQRLFFGGLDGQFYCVDAKTGKVLWTFPTRIENLAEPLVQDGRVFFLTGNGSFYALDAESGQQLWLYSRQDPNSLNVRGGSKPALYNEVLFVGFSDGSLVALNEKTGQLKWERTLNPNKKFRDLDTDPLVDGEFVYALGFDDKFYCLRSSTGELVWKSESGGYGGILMVGNRLFYSTTDSEFMAIDKTTGKKLWSYPLQEGIATSPALYRGLVVFGESQGSLVFVDSGTGKKIGSFDPGRGILSPPKIDEASNHVFFISGESNLYSLEIGFKFPTHFPELEGIR